jgi:hypothetical protein
MYKLRGHDATPILEEKLGEIFHEPTIKDKPVTTN